MGSFHSFSFRGKGAALRTFIPRLAVNCKENPHGQERQAKETTMQADLVPVAEQLLEASALKVPAGFTGNVTQRSLCDQTGVLGRQKQEVFLDVWSELSENDDLSDAGR
jgi:hypothetical protein